MHRGNHVEIASSYLVSVQFSIENFHFVWALVCFADLLPCRLNRFSSVNTFRPSVLSNSRNRYSLINFAALTFILVTSIPI